MPDQRSTAVGEDQSATSGPGRYAIVGTGWRAELFLRLARALPQRLQVAGVVTRRPERMAEVSDTWGVPAHLDIASLLAAERPDFVVVSVPWAVAPQVTEELVDRGVPVLCETPPAPDVSGLRALWRDVGSSALVQVAEQYPRYPGHAARAALVGRGLLGTPTEIQVSSTHQYHAMALIRGLLGVGFDDAAVTATRTSAPLLDPMDRSGWTGATEARSASQTVARIDFGGGRSGLYDFTDNQWHNPLRMRRIVVRGSAGELADDALVRMVGPRTVLTSPLVRRQTGVDLNLEGADLDHISFEGDPVYRNPWQGARLSDDEIAVATLLVDMTASVRGQGPPPYPLAQACQDHLLALAVEQSVDSGQTVHTDRAAWAS